MLFLLLVLKSVGTSFLMFWEVLWPLILGFFLSAVVQSVVSGQKINKLLGQNNLENVTLATFLGFVSSSCSYAAVAIARSLFKKGATFTNSMVFELASTNLVIELGIILIILMGWQFAAAEWLGGILMIIVIVIIYKLTLSKSMQKQALNQANKNLVGKMEGHGQMEMGGNIFTSVSHYFVMDIAAIYSDILIGFLIAGVLATFVPNAFWQRFFFINNPTLRFIEGPIVGPIIAIFSFVCSVGNIPLAAVLWNGGLSFGGVISFIFADLIVLPILNIYRKYYGKKMAVYILVTFFGSMALAGYLVEILFSLFHLIPIQKAVFILNEGIQFNYTTYLNIFFLILAVILIWRFLKTGGVQMLKMMGGN